MEIMIDCCPSWDIGFATCVAERVRDHDIKWFEDPLQNGWAKCMDIQPIFSILEGGPQPLNREIMLAPNKPGFGVELKRELLAPDKD